MDIALLNTIATFEAGIFDFLLALGVIIVALTSVRRADANAGYVLAGAMGIRFLGACCTRGVTQVMRDVSLGETEGMIIAATAIVRPWFDLLVWSAVIYVLVQLAKKAAPPS